MLTNVSKKTFREVLNSTPELNTGPDCRGTLRGARVRSYGDWLYAADKPMFDHLYEHYLATGSLEGV